MDRIEELRRLEGAATPGRWVSRKIEDAKDDWWSIDAPGDPPSLALVGPEDAAFIAAARNAMPLLLEVVEAAREIVDDGIEHEETACQCADHRRLRAALASLTDPTPATEERSEP